MWFGHSGCCSPEIEGQLAAYLHILVVLNFDDLHPNKLLCIRQRAKLLGQQLLAKLPEIFSQSHILCLL